MSADDLTPKRGRGRPPLPPESGKRHPFGFRATKELKERIERAARVSGRSVAHEVEHRLEVSFLQVDPRVKAQQTVPKPVFDAMVRACEIALKPEQNAEVLRIAHVLLSGASSDLPAPMRKMLAHLSKRRKTGREK